jgi:hypothetical protein
MIGWRLKGDRPSYQPRPNYRSAPGTLLMSEHRREPLRLGAGYHLWNPRLSSGPSASKCSLRTRGNRVFAGRATFAAMTRPASPSRQGVLRSARRFRPESPASARLPPPFRGPPARARFGAGQRLLRVPGDRPAGPRPRRGTACGGRRTPGGGR